MKVVGSHGIMVGTIDISYLCSNYLWESTFRIKVRVDKKWIPHDLFVFQNIRRFRRHLPQWYTKAIGSKGVWACNSLLDKHFIRIEIYDDDVLWSWFARSNSYPFVILVSFLDGLFSERVYILYIYKHIHIANASTCFSFNRYIYIHLYTIIYIQLIGTLAPPIVRSELNTPIRCWHWALVLLWCCHRRGWVVSNSWRLFG